eukprot:GFYU01003226.1.p1 GENE.GFYU01003226.1~~GFYU01003226.1.p1  ORF type:complete len:131 (-),score=35.67 GFYU01003226.1:69-461(-)
MADDPELAALRAQRMAELQAQMGGGGMDPQAMQQQQQQAAMMEQQRAHILMQILDNGARERLGRISVVKPEKARQIEDRLIQAARSGQLGGKVTEEALKSMLEGMQDTSSSQTKIVFQRRKVYSSDEDSD